ncbi:hypothetical protein [Metabacillus sediminilitoris]|uniref:hypothetical protein n=1 Tax=Metabacillus sediminilitoris TaxID=2567941 RepID=UPI001454CCC1|nr:hypothetical protein [Metabacillus sediminilitoris]
MAIIVNIRKIMMLSIGRESCGKAGKVITQDQSDEELADCLASVAILTINNINLTEPNK